MTDLNGKIFINEKINDYLEEQALLIFNHMFPNISYGLKHVGDYITPKRGKVLLMRRKYQSKIHSCITVLSF